MSKHQIYIWVPVGLGGDWIKQMVEESEVERCVSWMSKFFQVPESKILVLVPWDPSK